MEDSHNHLYLLFIDIGLSMIKKILYITYAINLKIKVVLTVISCPNRGVLKVERISLKCFVQLSLIGIDENVVYNYEF